MAEGISIRVGLEGQDELISALKEAGKEGTAAFDSIKQSVEGAQKPLEDLNKDLKETGQAAKQVGTGFQPGVKPITDGLSDVERALQRNHERFKNAGDEAGSFGETLKNLGQIPPPKPPEVAPWKAFGLVLLEIGTTVVVLRELVAGMVKLGEQEEAITRVTGRLTDLFGTAQKGGQAFAALESSSVKFGTTVERLEPILESFQRGLQNVQRVTPFRALRPEDLPFPDPANVEKSTKAIENFLLILRAGRLDQEGAEKSARAFFKAIEDGGPITSRVVSQLPVGTINLLKDALGGAALTTRQFYNALDAGAVSRDRFTATLERIGPEAQKAFDAKAVKTMSDEVAKLFATISAGFTKLGTLGVSQFIIGELSGLTKGLRDAGQEISDIIDKLANARGKALLNLTGGVTTGPTLEQAGLGGFVGPLPSNAQLAAMENSAKAVGGAFLNVSQSLEKLGAEGVNAGNKVADGANKSATAWKAVTPAISAVGDELEDAASKADRLAQQGAGGQAFKGRLNQIPVSVPQLAGEGGEIAKAGKDAGKTFIDNVNTGIKETPIEPVSDETKAKLNQLFSEEQTAEIAQRAKDSGANVAREFDTGINETPPNFASWSTTLDSTLQQMTSAITSWFSQAAEILQQQITVNIQARVSGGPAAPFAGGGEVFGPGTTTSDSILALLSRSEWVINARAVSFYGSALFSALNAMRLPRDFSQRYMTRAPHFAEGGQVSAPSSGTPLILSFGGRQFEASAPASVVSDLRRFAVGSQLASIGRHKPGFVR